MYSFVLSISFCLSNGLQFLLFYLLVICVISRGALSDAPRSTGGKHCSRGMSIRHHTVYGVRYYQLEVADEDRDKTTFVSKYSSEFCGVVGRMVMEYSYLQVTLNGWSTGESILVSVKYNHSRGCKFSSEPYFSVR